MWNLEYGEKSEKMSAMAARFGQKISNLAVKPSELDQSSVFYYEAFYDLDTERFHGDGWMRIPWSSIENYARSMDLDDEQTSLLHYVIPRVDVAWIKKAEEKRPKPNEK